MPNNIDVPEANQDGSINGLVPVYGGERVAVEIMGGWVAGEIKKINPRTMDVLLSNGKVIKRKHGQVRKIVEGEQCPV